MRSHEYIGNILGVSPDTLASVDAVMRARTGQAGVMEDLMRGNEERMSVFLEALGITARNAADMRAALYRAVVAHEQQLLRHLETVPGETQLEKAAALAKRVVQVGTGYFLKREYAKEILRKKKPEHLLEYLGCRDVEEVFRKVDVMEAFSALRFVETNEWMHAAFEDAYSAFTARDFEERQIDVRVLGPEWREVAEKFVAKKHHNVSHLKEFGVIFLNPIRENVPGKFLRDFALFLHYFHEIEFYAKLFRAYAKENDFPERFKALLRGDVKEIRGVGEAEWLIVQRYLFKENPRDPRLFLPR
ncbi:MAG: hypothetical protein HY436_01125, partial [Candidatus Liptonbacteria bacterium]|nr:hypothetical protein [Candidatus Liptonbacteria bacterium]